MKLHDLLTASLSTWVEQDAIYWDRIAWASKFGRRSERPLQFSWAYAIETTLRHKQSDYHVVCEQQRVDIGIRRWEKPDLLAAIEIKQWGNWWIDRPLLAEFEDDVRKVDGLPIPAAAVALCILPEKSDAYPWHHWMWGEEQKANRVETVDALAERTGKLNLTALGVLEGEGEPKQRLWVAAHYNASAETSI